MTLNLLYQIKRTCVSHYFDKIKASKNGGNRLWNQQDKTECLKYFSALSEAKILPSARWRMNTVYQPKVYREILATSKPFLLYEEVLKAYIARRSKYALCCDQIISRHPAYTTLRETDMHDPSWDELKSVSVKYQKFLCLNGNTDVVEAFKDIIVQNETLLSSIPFANVLKGFTETELWALLALTVGCMTPCIALLGIHDWDNSGYIMLDRTLTPDVVRTKTPIYDCFGYFSESPYFEWGSGRIY